LVAKEADSEMGKRSPNYPSLTLEQACEKAKKVYEQEHTHPAAREVVAQALGYGGLNGAALAVIGAITAYGLVEKVGTGTLKISPDAVSVFELDEGHPQRNEALDRLAFNPKLFDELRDKFGAEPPSDVNLKHFLIQEKEFLPKAATDVIRVYRANLELVSDENEAHNGGDIQPKPKGNAPTMITTARSGMMQTPPPPVQPASEAEENVREFSFPLSFQRPVGVKITIYGVGSLKARDLELLKTKIDGLFEGFEEEPEPRMATWRNKDHDQPVTITGELGERDGKRFYKAKETTTGIPEDELEFN
jgi:hypothetical protein